MLKDLHTNRCFFDEEFTSHLCTPDPPFLGAIKLRDTTSSRIHDDNIVEKTGGSNTQIISYKNKDLSTFPQDINSNIETTLSYKRVFNFYSDPSKDNILPFFAGMSKMPENPLCIPRIFEFGHKLNQITEGDCYFNGKM